MPVANDGISDNVGSMHAPSVHFPPAEISAPGCPGPVAADPACDDERELDANERPASSAAMTTTHSAPDARGHLHSPPSPAWRRSAPSFVIDHRDTPLLSLGKLNARMAAVLVRTGAINGRRRAVPASGNETNGGFLTEASRYRGSRNQASHCKRIPGKREATEARCGRVIALVARIRAHGVHGHGGREFAVMVG
jgi:hypothetical protein